MLILILRMQTQERGLPEDGTRRARRFREAPARACRGRDLRDDRRQAVHGDRRAGRPRRHGGSRRDRVEPRQDGRRYGSDVEPEDLRGRRRGHRGGERCGSDRGRAPGRRKDRSHARRRERTGDGGTEDGRYRGHEHRLFHSFEEEHRSEDLRRRREVRILRDKDGVHVRPAGIGSG